MAQAVIDFLEAVQVEEQHGQFAVIVGAAQAFQDVVEGDAVHQPGQRIAVGLDVEALAFLGQAAVFAHQLEVVRGEEADGGQHAQAGGQGRQDTAPTLVAFAVGHHQDADREENGCVAGQHHQMLAVGVRAQGVYEGVHNKDVYHATVQYSLPGAGLQAFMRL